MKPVSLYLFSLFLGLIWSICAFFFGLYAMKTKKGETLIEMASTIYFGYKPTLLGSLCGAFWGFLDGIISGTVIGFIYNKLIGF